MEDINNEVIEECDHHEVIDPEEVNILNKLKELLSLEEKIEETKKSLKELDNLYDMYNNLLETMFDLYHCKVENLNTMLLIANAKFAEKLELKKNELKEISYSVDKAKAELKEIEELKANSLNLPYF